MGWQVIFVPRSESDFTNIVRYILGRSSSGTFSNLADGSTLTVGNNSFQANYEGGEGNDLTLTVVPQAH